MARALSNRLAGRIPLRGMCGVMNRHQKPASKAVRALRFQMETTQADFAPGPLKMAVSTVRRWETLRTPAGESLLYLTRLAEKRQRPDLADVFLKAFRLEVRRAVPRNTLARWVAANG